MRLTDSIFITRCARRPTGQDSVLGPGARQGATNNDVPGDRRRPTEARGSESQAADIFYIGPAKSM